MCEYYSVEIEITPEMRRAGASVIQDLSGVVCSETLASRVYTAMAALVDAELPPHSLALNHRQHADGVVDK